MLRMLRSAVFIVPTNRRFGGRRERLRVPQVDLLVAVLEEVHQLAEDPGRFARFISSIRDELRSPGRPISSTYLEDLAGDRFERDASFVVNDRPEPFDELLVAVARVKLHDPHPFRSPPVRWRTIAFAIHVLLVPGGPAKIV